jgi:hypothetical protein
MSGWGGRFPRGVVTGRFYAWTVLICPPTPAAVHHVMARCHRLVRILPRGGMSGSPSAPLPRSDIGFLSRYWWLSALVVPLSRSGSRALGHGRWLARVVGCGLFALPRRVRSPRPHWVSGIPLTASYSIVRDPAAAVSKGDRSVYLACTSQIPIGGSGFPPCLGPNPHIPVEIRIGARPPIYPIYVLTRDPPRHSPGDVAHPGGGPSLVHPVALLHYRIPSTASLYPPPYRGAGRAALSLLSLLLLLIDAALRGG